MNTKELSLRWVMYLEGLGCPEDYLPGEFQDKVIIPLAKQSKLPFDWTEEERVEFLTQIITNASSNPIHSSQKSNGARISGHMAGFTIIQRSAKW